MATSTTPVVIQPNANFTVGLSWDQTSQRPADLDLACVAIGPTGLILDACFFNNPHALSGALIHSGDQTSGTAGGIDESITILSGQIPAFTYALVFCLMQPGSADLTACQSAQLHVWSPESQSALQPPVPLGAAVPAGCHFSVLGLSRRTHSGNWAFETTLYPFQPPAVNFMDVLPQLLALIQIDPAMAAEMKNSQPTFRLTKDGSWTIPAGLNQVKVGLGWDSRCDVDASCLAFDRNGKNLAMVYFGAKQGFNGLIQHSGDNTTGIGSGDDETILVRLAELPMEVDSIFFTVNVFSGGSFSDVKGEYCRLVDATQGPNQNKEMVRFDSLDNGNCRGVVLIGLYRNPNFPSQWVVSAPAAGATGNVCREMVTTCQTVQAKFRNNGVLPQGFTPVGVTATPAAPVQPPPPRIRVTLNGASNVTAMDFGGTSDPYCEVYMGKHKIFKTKTHKKTLNPVWNENFRVDLTTAKLTFKVWDHDSIGSDDKIGKIKDWQLPDVPPQGAVPISIPIVNKKGKTAGTLSLTLEKV